MLIEIKNKFLILMLTVALLFESCTPSKESTGEDATVPKPVSSAFKILSINLSHSLQDKRTVKKLAAWMKTTGAEVIAVQQIERATDSKPGFDAVTELTKELDMRSTFAKSRYYEGWDSGNALFCFYPMHQSNTYSLPTGKGKVRRSLAYAIFELGLKSMAFASTELDNEDQAERMRQINEIIFIQNSIQEYPIVVSGDFGEGIKGNACAKMLEKYQSANSTSDNLKSFQQNIFVPLHMKMNVVSAEKAQYKNLGLTGVLTTIEVFQ